VAPVEEVSSSMLLPDDSGPAPAFGEPEELSGSVLIEESPDGDGSPIVTRLSPGGEPAPEANPGGPRPMDPALPAQRAPLGMPDLPPATPPPLLGVDPGMAAPPAGPGHTDAALPGYPDPGGAPYAAQPAAGASARATPSEPPVLPRDVFHRALERGIERARVQLARARRALLAATEERPEGRPPWATPAVLVAGLFVGVGIVALLFALTGKHKGSHPTSASAHAEPAPATASTAPPALAAGAPAPARPGLTACSVTVATQVIAPAALVSAGVEVRPLGDGVAVGFAPNEHEARGLRIDPLTLATSGGVTAHSADTIRRVRPVIGPRDALALAVDADRKADPVHGRRTLPLDPPLQVGTNDGQLVWTRPGGGPAGKLWPVDGADDVDALRAASEGAPGDTTTVMVFRRGTEVWMGTATGYRSLSPKGDLSRVAGLGPSVGSPAVAVNDGAVIVAWSDRTSADEPWHLRLVHMKAGEPASEPVNFTPPPGGPGGHVMSPGLAAIPGGRFLLVWTEGPTSQQRVRAVTLDAAGEPVGKALEISNLAVNSGQGQAAVTATAGARGIVAFLQANGDDFQVAATAIACDQ
jgi:hypothetical protein